MTTTATDILIAITAHDEATTIGRCLDSVVAAVSRAQDTGVIRRARIAVAAHRCSDDTVEQALDHLGGLSGIETLVHPEIAVLRVGAVRSRLIAYAVAVPPVLPRDCWIFSTDADTVVPIDWVTGLLAAARGVDAELVLGLANLDNWPADAEARRTYQQILDSGLDADRHHHVYAANLAVTRSAYDAAGGFPAVPHGAEHALVRAIRAAGRRVASPLQPRVITSARMPGRAAGGLGELLAGLAAAPDPMG